MGNRPTAAESVAASTPSVTPSAKQRKKDIEEQRVDFAIMQYLNKSAVGKRRTKTAFSSAVLFV